MPRPRLGRRVDFSPRVRYFKPQGVSLKGLGLIELDLEEIEAFRLRHLHKLDQQESAKQMQTSVSTYQRILYSASEKIADALVNAKALKIN